MNVSNVHVYVGQRAYSFNHTSLLNGWRSMFKPFKSSCLTSTLVNSHCFRITSFDLIFSTAICMDCSYTLHSLSNHIVLQAFFLFSTLTQHLSPALMGQYFIRWEKSHIIHAEHNFQVDDAITIALLRFNDRNAHTHTKIDLINLKLN